MTVCKYCGKDFKNAGSHEKWCEQNPTKVQTEQTKQEPQQQERKTIQISNLLPYQDTNTNDLVAWFVDSEGIRINRMPKYAGLLVDKETSESIPCILVVTQEGTVLPPFWIPGFIGMFPSDYIFSEPDTTEQFPPFPVEEEQEQKPIIASSEPVKPYQTQDNEKKVIILPPQNTEPPRKKGLLDLLHKKEKTKEIPDKLSDDTNELLRKLTNANRT